MYPMSLPVASTTRTDAEQWIDDLSWHRQVYKQSKFRWWDTEAVLVATEFTGGRNNFRTIADLRELERYRISVSEYALTCQRALGLALKDVRSNLNLSGWDRVGDLLDLDPGECASSSFFATWADPYDSRQISNPQVRRIRRMCDGFFFASPLLLAWELKQLWRLYQAAEDVLEDTLVDLLVELRETARTQDLVRAIGMSTEAGLDDRIAMQRDARGPVGDPRRIPQQTFGPLPH